MPEKTLIQCDFDGTVTFKDVSFLLLDAFAGYTWRDYEEQYQQGKISVGHFSSLSFDMVKATKKQLLDYIKGRVIIRPAFEQFVRFCRVKDFRLVIVSNGLDFYISEILQNLELNDIEHHGAETQFDPNGLKVRYVNPDGTVIDNDFKLSYTKKYLEEGYRVVYIGDGNSDFVPAKQCHYIFATGSLLRRCQQNGIDCTPFIDFKEIIKILESW